MFDRIPDHVVTDKILIRLSVRSLLRCRSVCKHWQSVIDSRSYAATAARNADSIFLIAKDSDCYFYPIPDSSTGLLRHQTSPHIVPQRRLRLPPNNNGLTTICGSCHGLVCLRYTDPNQDYVTNPATGIRYTFTEPEIRYTFTEHVYVINPATGKHLSTVAPPPLPGGFGHRRYKDGYRELQPLLKYGFGYDSGTDDYKLIRVYSMVDPNSESDDSRLIWALSSFGIRSKTLQAASMASFGEIQNAPGVFVSGSVHWPFAKHLHRQIVIAAYDLGTNQCRDIPLPEACQFAINLMELRNCLGFCDPKDFLPHTGIDVWIMKEYGVKESWTKLFSVVLNPKFGSSKLPLPLGLSMNGDEAVLRVACQRLVCFDIKNQKPTRVVHLEEERLVDDSDRDELMRGLPERRVFHCFRAIAFSGSLVDPSSWKSSSSSTESGDGDLRM